MSGASRTFQGLRELPDLPHIVTIGSFDGVHRGHMKLLRETVERAYTLGLPSLALTFEPPPASVLRPERFPGRICSREEKLRLLASSGIDETAVVPFNLDVSQQSPEEFMSEISDKTHLRELWVGEAFALGKNRVGDVPRLREIGRQLGFEVVALQRVTEQGDVVSSSAIRAAILAGDATQARQMLGRPFRESGEVVHGAHLGRTIGYPTANVAPQQSLVPLADGIYATMATLQDSAGPRPAMTYIGTRPTVNSGARLVETHIFDFSGDIYGQIIDVDFYERLRGDATFSGLDELIAQLQRDEAAARVSLAAETSIALGTD
jgi:riboflavin kinase/FMN adenylyltransferase